MRAAVIIHQAKQTPVLRGHPWIYPKAIVKTKGNLRTGELVDVFAEDGEHLAIGVYNEHSLYRVRILFRSWEPQACQHFEDIIAYRLDQAFLLRKSLNLPNVQTNAYRLFNSEADGLSGLTIDCFNDYYVVSSSAYWVEQQRQLIYQCLDSRIEGTILWFPQTKSLTQDGWQITKEETHSAITQISEQGVQFEINFSAVQKTGLFIDQRDNHQRIAALAQDKKVLDLYTYTGGFALHAAKAGAVSVTAVDSSSPAIAQAQRNAQLNGLETIDFIAADARNYLAVAGDYDIVILDPPKLVPSKRDLNRAKNYYRFLHRELFKTMKKGALLMTCNCSAAMSAAEFTELVSMQALMVERQVRIIGIYGPAACHPLLASFPEGNYLTAVLLSIV